MLTDFKDKNHKSKTAYKKYKTLNTILGSVDKIVIIAATSNSITLSITVIGLIISPISAGIKSTLSLGNKVLHEISINKHNEDKKQNKKKSTNSKFFR